MIKQSKIRLVLTTLFIDGGEINAHINKHGDGVKAIALLLDDAMIALEECTKRGADLI